MFPGHFGPGQAEKKGGERGRTKERLVWAPSVILTNVGRRRLAAAAPTRQSAVEPVPDYLSLMFRIQMNTHAGAADCHPNRSTAGNCSGRERSVGSTYYQLPDL